METTAIPRELNMNVLAASKNARVRGEHGWYTGGSHSFDHLLRSRVVKDWLDNYTSPSTRKAKMYQFQQVLLASGFTDPADLLKLSDEDAKRLVKRVAQFHLQNGKGAWARVVTITMRGFYEAHDRELKFKRAEKIRSPPLKKIVYEHIPDKAEAHKMADTSGSLRNRAMILSLLQSGVRVGCLKRWTYGLVESQLYPEVKVPVEIRITTAMDTKLNLYGLPYYITYLHEEAAHALKDYIEERKRRGWKPQPRDEIFVTESSASRDEPIGSGTGVWEVVKRAAQSAGLDPKSVWTHTLRKTFRKILNATPEIDEDTREALMGHKLPGSKGSYFDYHDTDEVREKYLKADWSRNGGGNKLKVLEEKNKELEARLAEAKRDFGRDVDNLRRDFATLNDLKIGLPQYKGEFEHLQVELQKVFKLRKEVEDEAKIAHKLTKMLARRAAEAQGKRTESSKRPK